ncbi:deaminase domain-containing protein [Streptomyces sp. JL1001]|uniref:deaminase domain-containing protein n=1 Tax=Streptomyces sp. JL1001 TaxID=3078227 RepID=UPI00339BB74B
MVPSPGDVHAGYPQRYIPVGETADSEAKVFNYLADKMGPPGEGVSGTIQLHTQRPMCDSCSGVMDSFQKDYPDVRVIVTNG